MNSLKAAVVGVGALGRHHARILNEMEGIDLIGVADPRAEQGKKVADDCRTRWVADYRELLTDVDIVSIVVPTFLHYAVASDFLDYRVATLVEKPLTASVPQAEALVALAREKDVVLQVGHIERFNPAYEAAAARIKNPGYIRMERLSPFPFRSTDISVVHDMMIHDIELVLNLVDSSVESIEAMGFGVMGADSDTAQARLKFRNGCIADLTASRLSPVAKRTIQAWCPSGWVDVDLHQRTVKNYQLSPSLVSGMTPVELSRQPGADIAALKEKVFGEWITLEEPEVEGVDQLTEELGHFVTCVRQHRTPLVDGHVALKALRVADGILNSMAANYYSPGRTLAPAAEAVAIKRAA